MRPPYSRHASAIQPPYSRHAAAMRSVPLYSTCISTYDEHACNEEGTQDGALRDPSERKRRGPRTEP
ncbi:hypothetical protein EYF80_056010 [Liparis tanakae]|uniref:Uncharacterized protein n=1 Tax=Liparis tanakae TaxID=230148 RepID=A0A4Z2EY87_9TELE|nr:hypothetical protein EYF80_056010 [Liparis tanakae]